MKIAKIIRIASIFCYVNSYITRLPRVSAHAQQFSLSQSPYRGVPNPDAELNQKKNYPNLSYRFLNKPTTRNNFNS